MAEAQNSEGKEQAAEKPAPSKAEGKETPAERPAKEKQAPPTKEKLKSEAKAGTAEAQAPADEKAAEAPSSIEATEDKGAPQERQVTAPATGKVRDLIKYVEEKNLRKDLPDFQVGDTVRVSIKIVEKDKTRIQNFDGVVIRRSGRGVSESFTVRRISFGVGVEKSFPVNSPSIAGIKVLRAGVVRRARLYYLRGLSGREARIKEDEKRLAQAKTAKTGRKKAKAAESPKVSAKQAKRRAAKDKKKGKREARRKAKTKKK